MLRCLLIAIVSLVSLDALAAGDAVSPGDDAKKAQVRLLLSQAEQSMNRKDYAGAVAQIQQAQRLLPDPVLDYNLGVVYAEWGNAPQAAMALSRFLRGVQGGAVTKDRVADAERRLSEYRTQLCSATIAAPKQGGASMVWVDGQFLGQAPVEELLLRPGNHSLRVSGQGMRDYIVTVTMTAGQKETFVPDLVPAVSAAVSAPERERGEVPIYKKWWFWVPVIGGTALAAGLIGAGAAGRFDHTAPGSDLPAIEVAR